MSGYVCKSPVLVCGFNRPDLLKNCLEHVRAVNPPRLYISIDGPRQNVKNDAELVEQCREIARSVTWCPDVKLKIEPVNLGCRKAMQSALDWFYDGEPEGIILEDDIEATPAFFSFCDTMLERYRNDPTIACVNGWTPVPEELVPAELPYLTKYPHIWGWATWRRAWQPSEKDAAAISLASLRSGTLLTRSHGRGIDSFWWDRLKLIAHHGYDTWDVTFALQTTAKGELAVSPPTPYSLNRGFGVSSTHTSRQRAEVSPRLASELSMGVKTVPAVDLAKDLDWAHDKYHFGFGEGANYWPRLKSKIYYYLNIIPYGKSVIKAINRFRSS